MSEQADRLRQVLARHEAVVVAFSGGVDSALVAVAAAKALPPGKVTLITADSDSLADGELDRCREFAEQWQIPWRSVGTREMENPDYVANGADRCYWCKTALMDEVGPLAAAASATVLLGVNVDDLSDHRPGQQAASERGAVFPLVEAGFTKADVRAVAKQWGLEVWDRPSMPCLSSRIPYGSPVTLTVLSRIDRAEAYLRRAGLIDVRVRDYGDTARIETATADFALLAERADEVVARLTALGYEYVTLDLAGLRSGNLNKSIARAES